MEYFSLINLESISSPPEAVKTFLPHIFMMSDSVYERELPALPTFEIISYTSLQHDLAYS